MTSKLHIRDIILIALIAVMFGGIYILSNQLYNALVFLGPLANDICMGLWCMAGPLAGFVVKLPGTSFLGELLSAAAEGLFGGQWGISTLISGIVQGIGSELGFAAFIYRKYNIFTLIVSATINTFITFGWDFMKNGYNKLPLNTNLLCLGVRWISMIVFCTIIVNSIVKLLDKAHVLTKYNH